MKTRKPKSLLYKHLCRTFSKMTRMKCHLRAMVSRGLTTLRDDTNIVTAHINRMLDVLANWNTLEVFRLMHMFVNKNRRDSAHPPKITAQMIADDGKSLYFLVPRLIEFLIYFLQEEYVAYQCSAQVFKRAGCRLKRAHLAG